MVVTIPFTVEDSAKLCVIQLRDLSQENVLAEIFRGECQPGTHSVQFNPSTVEGELEAGVYVINLTIGEQTESHPMQYMP